ncbi:ABC transporter substrate-binding protein [Pedobacter sp. MC2016-14]|uniref:ABC transporter substrate-binding protein n=1 Tax=Pedobacter sp. MC2016-14 TaxID=2897327 RepID=UPI001E6384C7|nr:ABC transporter substrate-binding protein [Pedobacter sp. MC2016-14]MCD0490362.1 ABC transporter substrate-binding protein [Pedobacter sp. MC2016-14]
MISAQNHLQQLSGNRFLILIFIGLCFSACSPKIQPVVKQPSAQTTKVEPPVVKKFTEAEISLLVPFKLNTLHLKTASKGEVDKASMAIDFYQGVKLGIDSAAALGFNFKLNVLDTEDDHTQLADLQNSGKLKHSNLLIGPVFPDGIKYMRTYALAHNLYVVSPLAASQPEEFGNPNLISIVNNVDLHAAKIGNYIASKYLPAGTVVVLINPKKSDDEVLGSPLRDYFKKGKGIKFVFEEYASVFTLETKLQKGKKYVVMLSSADQSFVAATLDKLVKMKQRGFNADLFGHPNWLKQNYNIDKLQALNTIVSSSYRVDYKSPAVIAFVKKYRAQFKFEPDEYSFKGFDIGFYFARQLAKYGPDFQKYLTKSPYKGLHNSFSFVFDEKNGYINTSLQLLNYRNYALIPVL